MKKTFFLVLSIVLLIIIPNRLVQAKQKKKRFPTESNIISMDDENFEDVVNTYKNVFVYFYVPMCSHEEKLTSTFKQAYNKYYKKKASIKFGRINAFQNQKYAEMFDLRGYAALILFKGSLNNSVTYESEIALYDFRSFIDIHVYNKIRQFENWEQYQRNKLGFEIAFMGNKTQFPNIYDYFVERSKNATLYRYISLPQDEYLYWSLTNEMLANETHAFIPYQLRKVYDEKEDVEQGWCQLYEPGDEIEEGFPEPHMNFRGWREQEFTEFTQLFRGNRARQVMRHGGRKKGLVEDDGVFEGYYYYDAKTFANYSEYEDHFMGPPELVQEKCEYFSRESDEWEKSEKNQRAKAFRRAQDEEFEFRRTQPYVLQYPLQFQADKSYIIMIKRHENFTVPLELVDDNVTQFQIDFDRMYKNYSSFTYPYHK